MEPSYFTETPWLDKMSRGLQFGLSDKPTDGLLQFGLSVFAFKMSTDHVVRVLVNEWFAREYWDKKAMKDSFFRHYVSTGKVRGLVKLLVQVKKRSEGIVRSFRIPVVDATPVLS